MKNARYTQGVEGNGAAILLDGYKVSIDEIVRRLNVCEPQWVREVRFESVVIAEHDSEYMWIGTGDGEGGLFNKSELEAVINKFYQDNF